MVNFNAGSTCKSCGTFEEGPLSSQHKCDIGLRLYRNEYETYCAYSKEDALVLALEMTGQCEDEYLDENGYFDTVHGKDDEITVFDERLSGDAITNSAAWWCEYNGRGFLCSTEY